MAKDPVCQMDVDEKTAKGQTVYKGQSYYFCSPGCKTAFDQDPERYLGHAGGEMGHGMGHGGHGHGHHGCCC